MKGLTQSFTLLRTTCAAALLMCYPVTANIWTNSDAEVTAAGVNLNKQVCMADAYIKAGGKGLSNALGESLNCTANDVVITQVVPVNPAQECTLGEVFTFNANVTVSANASERWDTTFYLPLNNTSPQLVQGAGAQNCSLVIPKPGEEGASQLDGDQCGDIKKAGLVNGKYVLQNEPITMQCADADGDNRADFSYCAAWDNISRNNCTLAADPVVGQVPNNKSKCNCDSFNIAVFIKPKPPTLSKTLLGSDQGSEPEGTFKYELTMTKDSGPADLVVTSLHDIVRSSTDAAIFADFNLSSTTDVTVDTLTLLGTDADNTCDDLALPRTLTTASPSLSCVLVMKVADEDLPDDGSPELYQDFIRANTQDIQGTPIGNSLCDMTDADPSNDSGNCSGVVTVKMLNVDPVLKITKVPMSGPGLHKVGGAWFIDESGNVTYEVVITNNSPVDAVLLSSLVDTAIADLLSDNSGNPACSDGSGKTLAKGDSFTCQYVTNVSIGQGDTYANTVTVAGKDNEERPAGDSAMAAITLATPSIVLVKEVAAVTGNDLNAVAGFAEEANVNEPGAKVVYRFTITNTNNVTQEALTLSDFSDDVLFASARASKSATQRSDECDFTTVVAYGAPYSCTLVADVTGNATGEATLINTAQVKAKAPNDKEVASNEDMATVNFLNVPPAMAANFALKATVFIKVKNTTFEDIHLTSLKLLGMTVEDGTLIGATGFLIRNAGGEFGVFVPGACPEPAYSLTLAPDAEFSCAFSVEFAPIYTPEQFNAFTADITSGDAVIIEFADEEGSTVSADATVQITTE
ncbi:hypothetical protein ACW5WQ_14490 [Aeromonas rivuli]|uniref:hypothetical protein n=1 Tax=Aeromonas rivuli TaxID=648794 RepID=UPI000693635F|nr:hypothetical protein [Aeromonas rivuli]